MRVESRQTRGARGWTALSSTAVGATALALALALLLFGSAVQADDPPPAPAGKAAPEGAQTLEGGKGVSVKIAITETIDGKPSRYMAATYFIRKKLREAGFRAWSEKKLPPDDKAHKKAVAAAKAKGKPEPAYLEEQKPAPGLVIEGKCEVRFDRASTFYGQDLASIYASSLKLEIKEPDGNVLSKIDISDEWGKETKRRARNESLQRIGLFGAVDVLRSDAIQGRLTKQAREAVQPFIDKIQKQRSKKAKKG